MRRIGCYIVVAMLTISYASVQAANLLPPFQSTPDEEKNVDHLLARWEQWNAGVKSFDCRFKLRPKPYPPPGWRCYCTRQYERGMISLEWVIHRAGRVKR